MSEWTLRPLGDLTINLDSKRIPVKESERRPGPYPYYGASGVVDHIDAYIFEGLNLLIAEDGENLRTRRLPIAFLANGKYWVNNHAHIVHGNDYADTKFLCYALQCADIASYLTGSTMPKLTQGNLNRIPIYAPIRTEQQAIASVFGALDDKIDLNRRMNETLEAMARAIFKDWFVDFGPTRAKMEGRAPYLAQEIWDLFPAILDAEGKPEGWEVSTIGQEVEVVGGTTPSTKESNFWNGEINWATPKDLSSLRSPVVFETGRKITAKGLTKISSGLLPSGTVLLSSRAPIGYVAITEVPLAINQGFIAMICNMRLANSHIWLWTHENMELILQKANGSTFQEISKGNFRPTPILVPSNNVRQASSTTLRLLYNRIVSNEIESHTLAQTRDILLPKLMSGEIRVKDAEKAIEAVL